MGVCGPTHDADSWTFDLDPGGLDPVLGIPRLKDAFEARFPGYPRGITVPAVVDVPSGKVVTNDFARLTLDLSTQWRAHHRDGAPDLYPEALRAGAGRRHGGASTPRSTTGSTAAGSRAPRPPTRSLRPALRGPRLADGAARRPPLPRRRHHHRGRRPAVHDAGPLRRGLPRALQVQPAEAVGDAGPVGLRARPVPDRRASATRPTSCTSRATTTRSTPTSTRPASSPPGPDLAGLGRAARARGARRPAVR